MTTFEAIADVKATAEEPFVHLHDAHSTRSSWRVSSVLMQDMSDIHVLCFFGMSHTSTWSQTNDLGVNYEVTRIHRSLREANLDKHLLLLNTLTGK
jgi:hypothetical protein